MRIRKSACLVFLAVLIGCGSSDDDDEDDALPTLSAQEVMSQSASSVSSAGALMVTSSALALQDEEEGESESDETCTNKGRPWDPDEDEVKGAGDDDFPVDSFRCMMTIDGGSDTPLGFLKQWSFIICAIEEANGAELEFDTDETTVDVSINPSEASADCKALTSAGIKSQDVDFEVEITTQDITAGGTGWQRNMTLDSDSFGIDVRYAQDGNRIALQVLEPSDDSQGVSSLVLDTDLGVLLFEGATDNGDDLVDHRRIKVTGEIGDDLEFTSVTAVQGLDFVCIDTGCTEGAAFTGASVKGAVGDAIAFRAHQFDGSSNPSCLYGAADSCENEQEGCTGDSCDEDPVEISSDSDDDFFEYATYKSDFFDDTTTGPLCFNNVTNATVPTTSALADCELTADSF